MGKRNEELRSPIGRVQDDERLKLWIEFLKLSPSYNIAQDVIDGKISFEQGQEKVSDLHDVIENALEFGNVWGVDRERYYHERSFELFGVQLAEPDLKVVHVMKEGEPIDMRALEEHMRDYTTYTREEMGNPFTVLVSIPIDLNRQYLMRVFGGMLTHFKANRQDLPSPDVPRPMFVMKKNRTTIKTLEQMIRVVETKAMTPHLRAWQLGTDLRLNATHADTLSRKDHGDVTDAKASMNATVAGIISKGLLLAENAARGHYPSLTKSPNLLKSFDYDRIRSNIERHGRAFP